MTESELVLLHHRSALGEVLSPDECAALTAWYDQHDAEDARRFSTVPSVSANDALKGQLSTAIAKVEEVTLQIQKTISENERIRREIEAAKGQLAEKTSERAA